MPGLIYSAIMSPNGRIVDKAGSIAWDTPHEELHTFINNLQRPIASYLYGLRMYQTVEYWETVGASEDQPSFIRDFAEIWRAADKIVYSKALDVVASAKARQSESSMSMTSGG